MKSFLLAITLLIAISLSAQTNHMDLMTTMTGEFNGSRTGKSVISLDFNGDGIKDLVILSDLWNPTGTYTTAQRWGKIYIYFGGTTFDNVPEYTIPGSYNKQFAVSTIYNAGDVNADGKEDIAMITGFRAIPPGTNQVYSLYIFYGREVPQSTPDYTMNIDYGSISDVWLSPLGDINADGYNDLSLVYATGRRVYRSYVLLGYVYTIIPFRENHQSYRGLSLSKIGDVNHDGVDDFHMYYPTSISADGDIRLTVYYGSNSFPDCDSLVICENTNQVIRMEACAIGDVNGDGIDDFVSNMTSTGKVWFGSSNLSSAWNVEFTNFLPGGTGTYPGVVFGDLNGDGFDDVIGSDNTVLIDNGRAGIWMGRTVFNGTRDLTLESPEISEQFGYSKAAGDFNNDGYCDVAISAPGVELVPSAPGYVYVYAGNAALHDTTVENDDDTATVLGTSFYDMDIFPNPIMHHSTHLNIYFRGEGYKTLTSARLTICNSKGQTVHQTTLTARQIKNGTYSPKVSKLGEGIYIVSIQEQGKVLTSRKVIVTH